MSIFDFPIVFFLHTGWTCFIILFTVFPCKQIWKNKHAALIFYSQYEKDYRTMDILAIRGKTVSAVISQLQWREFGRKFKIECCDQFSIFVFRNKNWSIDRIATDKSNKRRGPKCGSAQEGRGKGVRTSVGRKEEGAFYFSLLPSFTGLILA